MPIPAPDGPPCGWCDGKGYSVKQAKPGRCTVCRGTGLAPPPPQVEVPRKVAKLYEARQ